MKAMILAAGLGTRLRPLTDGRPKALVEIDGRTLLEISLSRLRTFGIRDVIINVHHCAEMILEYLSTNANFGMHIEVSREDTLLDTGGGLKKAAHFFTDDPSGADDPFILHNVDVISTIDLQSMVQFHTEHHALATLAVQNRDSSRYLLFDEQLQLSGRRSGHDQKSEFVRSPQVVRALAFCGIHVISTRFLGMMSDEGTFSIITTYLNLAARKERILAFKADESYWRDLGKLKDLERAAQDIKEKIVL